LHDFTHVLFTVLQDEGQLVVLVATAQERTHVELAPWFVHMQELSRLHWSDVWKRMLHFTRQVLPIHSQCAASLLHRLCDGYWTLHVSSQEVVHMQPRSFEQSDCVAYFELQDCAQVLLTATQPVSHLLSARDEQL